MHRFADDPILTAGFEYWLNLPKEAGVPDRRDVDAPQLPRTILPNVALLEIIDDCADARVRLAGQQYSDNFGFNMTGKRTTEMTEGEYRDYILGHFRKLVDSRHPIYSESAFRWDQGGQLRTRRVLMPLSHGQPGVIALIFKIQTWPLEQMRGLPFCEAIAGGEPLSHSEPQIVGSKDG